MFRFGILILAAVLLSACGGGGGGSSRSAPATPTPSPTPTPTQVPVTGTITYEFVPSRSNGGLDYDGAEPRPIRGATVSALNASNAVLSSTTSDAAGAYSLEVPQQTNVRIRVSAELVQSGTPSWDLAVTDNTNGDALYVLDGSLTPSGDAGFTADLHASSGWDEVEEEYAGERAAAPFAILDSVYEALQHVLAADPDVQLLSAELRWSVSNIAVLGNRAAGQIGTSSYLSSQRAMYILGHEDNDTDEYDKSVIQHEFAHYLEDVVSRSDSPGGLHILNTELDMRLAFGEGFANAFSGIVSGQEFYRDSASLGQAGGFSYSLEDDTIVNPGWFSESSIGRIFYDLADDVDDGADDLSLGFTPIYQAMTSTDYMQSTAFTSLYLLIDELNGALSSSEQASVDAILAAESVFGSGPYGEGETNSGSQSLTYVLPVYHEITIDGAAVNVCGSNQFVLSDTEYIRDVKTRRFIRFEVAVPGSYQFQAVKTLGTGERDPDILVFQRGELETFFATDDIDSETGTTSLDAGEYILEVFDYLNINEEADGGNSCFDVTITTT